MCVGLASVVEGDPSPNVHTHPCELGEALLVKTTVLSLVPTKLKFAVGGTQLMITGRHTVSAPHTLVEIRHTLKVPTDVNAWIGFTSVDVVPSPKSQRYVGEPEPLVWFWKEPMFAFVVKLKLALGAGQATVMDLQKVFEPHEFTAVRQT